MRTIQCESILFTNHFKSLKLHLTIIISYFYNFRIIKILLFKIIRTIFYNTFELEKCLTKSNPTKYDDDIINLGRGT